MGENIVISLGFSTTDLAKYNSSMIFKSVFNGINMSTDEKATLNTTYSGINTFTSNPKTALSWGASSNSSGYEGIIALFKIIAAAKAQKGTNSFPFTNNTTLELPLLSIVGNTSNIQSSSSDESMKANSIAQLEAQLKGESPESPMFQSIIARLKKLDSNRAEAILKESTLAQLELNATRAKAIKAILKESTLAQNTNLELNATSDFDSTYYAQNNPDVLAVYGNDPVKLKQHFETFGKKEGRNPNKSFDVKTYLAQNTDVKAAVDKGEMTAFDHWNSSGKSEGRKLPKFDKAAYLAKYPDLKAAADKGGFDAYDHWINTGIKEGRTIE